MGSPVYFYRQERTATKMIMNKINPKHIVFPKTSHISSKVSWSLTKNLANGWVNITAKIPQSCIDSYGLISKDIVSLLRTPCAESRFKLRSLYKVEVSYDYHLIEDAVMPVAA